jgi:hypothetical protein
MPESQPPPVCALCQHPLRPTAVEQALAAGGLAPLPIQCQICRLLRRTAPPPLPPPPPPPSRPPVVHTLANYPRRPSYGQQPMRLFGEVVAWMQRHDGRLPMSRDFIHDTSLPTLPSLWQHVGTLAQFYVALEASGLVPGAAEAYRLAHYAQQCHGIAAARRAQRFLSAEEREVSQRRRYRERKAAHCCVTCGAPAVYDGTTWRARCAAHLLDIAERSRRRPSRARSGIGDGAQAAMLP